MEQPGIALVESSVDKNWMTLSKDDARVDIKFKKKTIEILR